MLSMALVKRYPVAVFFGASVSIGWIVTIAAARLPGATALLPLVAIPVSYVPAAAALVVLRVAGTEDDKRALRRRLTTVRVDKRWYAVALLVPPLVHLSGVALATLAGGTFAVQPAMFALLPLFLITSLGEEIGWRGYAQPKLQERMTPLAAAIVVGLVWAAFHWVALLANAETPLAYVIVSTFQLMALSIILAILFNEGRQALILVVLAHAMYDTASVGVAPFASTGVPLVAFALSAAVTWVVAIGMLVVLGQTQTLARPSEATPRPVVIRSRILRIPPPERQRLRGSPRRSGHCSMRDIGAESAFAVYSKPCSATQLLLHQLVDRVAGQRLH